MNSKEQLAEQYADEQNSAYTNDYYGFLAGYEEGFAQGQPKWIDINTELPDNDRTVLVWINDTENPQWSGYKLGSYLNEKWYCKGGRKSHEIVTDWCQIPGKK